VPQCSAAFHALNFPPAWYEETDDAHVQAVYETATQTHPRLRPRKDGLRLKADDTAAAAWVAVGGCGSCYGAAEDGVCCDTCDDVRQAYRRNGWSFDNHEHRIDGIAQVPPGC
jgi:hypothetical protein